MRRAAVLVAAMLAAGAAHASDEGRTGARTLTRTAAARPSALAGAYVAVDGSLGAAFYNPAGVAGLAFPQVESTYERGLADDALGGIDAAVPAGPATLWLDAAYFDGGTIDVNLSDGTQGTRRAQQDTVGGVGIAVGRHGPIALGAAVKGYRLELAEDARASGAAADVGLLFRTPLPGLALGASATNLGPEVTFESAGDPLPTMTRAGLAYVFDVARMTRFKANPYVFALTADVVSERRSSTAGVAGLELTRRIVEMDRPGSVSLRGGYASAPQTITAGLGLRLGAFGLDYALSVVQDLDNAHRFTVSWRFGSPEDAERPNFRQRIR